ncbi:MAG: MBL fold metallo-hydrolase, partial [Firmicutes bacterium]|nr:MBL fold metallo-hydrolase [Bacillota bacterium]
SKGNATLISHGGKAFLIDCGIPLRVLKERLLSVGFSLNEIDFALITHEHSDHIYSCEQLSDSFGIPLYSHEKILRGTCRFFDKKLKNMAQFTNFNGFKTGDFTITPFFTPHDAFTVGYRIATDNKSLVYITDTGRCDNSLIEISAGADLVMIEANHDKEMLINGSYPPYLKRRILSDNGHLSNETTAEIIAKMASNGTKKFILAHLSEENNTREKAYSTVAQRLNKEGFRESDYLISVAGQHFVLPETEI